MGTLKKWTIVEPTSKDLQDQDIIGEFCERPQKRASYDSNVVKDILSASSRFKTLKSEVKFKILEERHKYGYLKQSAISILEANLKKQFNIFSRMIAGHANISHDLTHDIFSWNWSDFLLRRALKDFVWVDVLLRMDSSCLHANKYRRDLEQLQLFLEKVFDGLFSDIVDEDIDIYEHIEKPIDDAKKALLTTDYAENELKANAKELKHIQYNSDFIRGNAQRLSTDTMQKHHLQHRLSVNRVYNPIETRYQLRWLENVVKQEKLKMQKAVEKRENEIDHYRRQLDFEKYIDDSYMDYCYSSIEAYKIRITDLQYKFEKSFEEMESNITYMRLKIEKVMDQRKFLSDEILRFHKEEEEMLIRLQNKEEEIENLSKRRSKPPSTIKPRKKKSEKKGKTFKLHLKK